MSAPAAQPVLPVDDSDDDMPSLSEELLSMISPEARAALEAHRAAQRQAAEKLAAEKADGSTEIGEDFGMSQFWYSDECADEMATALVEAARSFRPDASPSNPLRVACISAPSTFKALKRLAFPDVQPFVLEYDRRFATYGKEFIFYDFHAPSVLDSAFTEAETGVLRKSFDGVCADPPYLNEECMTKYGETIRLLSRSSSKTAVLFNTGAILRKPIRLVLGCRPCVKRPRHRVHLMNEFISFTNFDSARLEGWEKEEQ